MLLFNYTRPSHPIVLGAGSTQMQLDSAGSSEPGDQHSVALYDPSGTRLGRARLRAHLVDHGPTLAAHLGQRMQPKAITPREIPVPRSGESHQRAKKGREGSKKLHVHYHQDSPPPGNRSHNCKRHARAASRRRQRHCKHCSRERPMTGPADWGKAQTDWLQSDDRTHPLSAPSTPWYGPTETSGEKLQTEDRYEVYDCAPVVESCTASQQPDCPKRDAGTVHQVEQPNPMLNCTICGSGHRFNRPATQDITAVACEMMTLVSMRTAMSEVLGNLVNKWKDVMPASMDLPEMSDMVHAKGKAAKEGDPSSESKIPVPTGAENQWEGMGRLGEQHASTQAVQCAKSEQMLQTYEPEEKAQGQASQGYGGQTAACSQGGQSTNAVSGMEHSQSGSKFNKGSAQSVVNTNSTEQAHHSATNGASKERHKQHGSRMGKKPNAQREDSMSGPFQVTFAPNVTANGEKRSSSRRTHSHRRCSRQDNATAVEKERTVEDQNLASKEVDDSTGTQEVRSSTGLGWADSAGSGALKSGNVDTSAPSYEQSAPQKSSNSSTSIQNVAVRDIKSTESAAECANDLGVPNRSAPPDESEGIRSDSFWPLSETDAEEVQDPSHGIENIEKGGSNSAVAPRAEGVSGDAQTVLSDGSSGKQCSQSYQSKVLPLCYLHTCTYNTQKVCVFMCIVAHV